MGNLVYEWESTLPKTHNAKRQSTSIEIQEEPECFLEKSTHFWEE